MILIEMPFSLVVLVRLRGKRLREGPASQVTGRFGTSTSSPLASVALTMG